jgi:hypothetical protein
MSFWKSRSSKAFIVLIIISSLIVLLLDIEAIALLSFTLEKEIIFPALGAILLVFGLIALNKKVSGKSDLLKELIEMSIVSKIFFILTLFLIIVGIFLALFQDLSLIKLNPQIISEEQIIAIAMILTTLIFIFVHSKELSVDKHV